MPRITCAGSAPAAARSSISTATAATVVALLLCACSPTYNWRDVPVGLTGLKGMLPCKPDKATREVTMVERKVALEVIGCEAGGATFALLHADIGDASRAGDAIRQWRIATLANLRGTSASDVPFAPPGSTPVQQAAQVMATGQRSDGSKVQSQAAYFARGSQVFQAVIYADELRLDITDPFFSNLKFQ